MLYEVITLALFLTISLLALAITEGSMYLFTDLLKIRITSYNVCYTKLLRLIVTALLTLAGYSLNDTVIVFDRVRENMRKHNDNNDIAGIINNSVNEVMSRTIATSLTTVMALLPLYFLGGTVLHDFSFA